MRIVASAPAPVTQSLRPLIELDRISKVFRPSKNSGIAAIADFSLTVFENTATLVTGASGSGKTTLLNLVGCLIRPTSGRIRVADRDVSRLPEEELTELRRRRFGFVFQDSLLLRGMSAITNVMLPAMPLPEVGSELSLKARSLLKRFSLEDRARERVERLSGGEKQRVAIARALINDPEVVLADEPTAHLGLNDTLEVLCLLSDLIAQGKTVLVASHDQRLLQSAVFNQVVTLRDGRLDSAEG